MGGGSGTVYSSWDEICEAVANASDGDVFRITGNINATSSLTINKSITIESVGETKISLGFETSSSAYKLFDITAGTITFNGENSVNNLILDGNSTSTAGMERLINITGSGSVIANYVTMQNLPGTSTASAIFANSSGGTITLNNVTIKNIKGKNGAGINLNSLAELNLNNTTIEYCEATSIGGAINITMATICNIKNCIFRNNKVTEANGDYFGGGAIAISNANAVVTIDDNTLIENNISNNNGGGIIIDSGTLYIKSATIQNNIADNSGQNIYSTTNNADESGIVYIGDQQQDLGSIDANIIGGLLQ